MKQTVYRRLSLARSALAVTALVVMAMSALTDLAQAGTPLYTVRVPIHGMAGPAAATPGDGTSKAGACASGAASTCASFGGSLTVTVDATHPVYTSSTCKTSGKWYFEYTPTVYSGNPLIRETLVGVTNGVAGSAGNGVTNAATYAIGVYATYYNKSTRNSESSIANSTAYSMGETVGVAVDLDAKTLTLYRAGNPNGVVYSGMPVGSFCPVVVQTASAFSNTATSMFNFGQSNFAFAVPTGYNRGVY